MKSILLLFLLVSCSTSPKGPDHLVLIHDAHFDERSLSAMDRYLGAKSVVVSLPTTTKLGNADEYYKKLTLRYYAEAVCHKVQGLKGSIVLVAHGFGGAVANEAFGQCPKAIVGMIFIASPIPFPGERPYQLGTEQDNEFYLKAVEEDQDSGLFVVSDWYNFINTFASDADDHQREYIKNLAGPNPIAPAKTLLNFNLGNFQDLSKLVIITKSDKVLSPETQKRYTLRLKNTEVRTLNADHMAPITHTDEVGELIKDFIK